MPPEGSPEDETCLTFVLNEEDHTLGNALRYVIMKKYVLSFPLFCMLYFLSLLGKSIKRPIV